jgi:hypothetical protein
MKALVIICVAFGALAGCVGNAPMPLAASGPVAVSQGGAEYIVDLQPTSGGAEMIVSADAGPLGMDQGLTAKRVAEAFCAGRGSRIDPRALGRFAAGQWVFNGGCA